MLSMPRLLFFLFIMIAIARPLKAGDIIVEKIETVSPPGERWFHPVFDRENRLYVSTENYIGLYRLANNKTERLSEAKGAGFRPRFLPDEVIVNPWYWRNGRRYFRVTKINLKTLKAQTMREGRFISPVLSAKGNIYVKSDVVLTTLNNTVSSNVGTDSLAYAQDSLIILQAGTVIKKIKPAGEGHYIWVGMSPDKKHILFRKAGAGAFVIDWSGTVMARFPKANAPRWSPDGRYIACMEDEDDGYRYTASDICIIDWRSGQKWNITRSDDAMEMYPSWSADGRRLAFHTLQGEIRVAYLKK